MTYIFSYRKPTRTPYLVRRPWWNLWGRDKIEYKELETGYVHNDVSEDESQMLQNDKTAARLIQRLIPGMWMVQLEAAAFASSYIATKP